VGFSLRKWYLDCVSDAGETAIAYRAELRWEAFSLQYASLLEFDPAHGTRVRSTLRRCGEPSASDEEVRWEAGPLEVSGTWHGLAPEFSAELLAAPEGTVVWRCVQPRSRAELRLPGGRTLAGLGYVEELTLTFPPWRLPIDELRWGRFASGSRGLVWIEWRGPHPVRLALVDGERAELSAAAEERVDAGGVSLELSQPAVLRTGRIGETVLSVIPGIERVFPGRILGLQETKWRARGTLQGAQGWAIHEVVRWPR